MARRLVGGVLAGALAFTAIMLMVECTAAQPAAANQRADSSGLFSTGAPPTPPAAPAAPNSGATLQVTISPSVIRVPAGATIQVKAAVTGASNQAVTWTTALGSITPAGLYTAPTVSAPTVDTIYATSAADPTQYAAVSVSVQATTTSCSGPYSITTQEPITCVPSPGSMFAKRLPADVMSHRMANDVTIAVSSIKACNPGACSSAIVFARSGSANDTIGMPAYYGKASDPAYVITGGHTPVAPYNSVHVAFHAPNRAMTSGASAEQFFTVWDQSQGKYFSLYRYTGGSGSQQTKFPSCGSTSLSSPCNIGFSPSDSMQNSRTEVRGYGVGMGNPWASNGLAAPIGRIRVQELIQGHIYHPLYLNVLCEANSTTQAGQAATVFPDTIGFGALPCSKLSHATSVAYAPPAGALYFLDYTDAQLALLKAYMPAWQYPIVEALTHYGGYAGDTGNPLHPSRVENEDAYKTAGVQDPIFAWLHGQKGVNSECGGSTASCVLPWTNFAAAGGTCPEAGLCDITKHIHIANQCIAKGLAGMTSTQGACF